jgi:hypothetical protein
VRLAVAVAALVAIASAVSCSKCGNRNEDPAQTMKPAEPLLPAPDKLLADVYIATPNSSWSRLQRNIGGAVGILPASASGMICMIAGLDPFVASEIDGAAPIFGVIAGDPANASYVVAMKLLDMRKARAGLVDGETAHYSERDAGGVSELVPKGQSNPMPVAFGLSPNGYLLLARRSEDLAKLAPYATRTLPRRTLPSEGAIVLDVPRAALGSVVKPALDDLWTTAKAFLLGADERMRRDHGGRAPDYGDPKAIVRALDGWVTKRIAVVGDLEKMRIAVDVVETGLTLSATMTPVAGAGAARKWTDDMKLGDVEPLLSLPSASAAALLVRDTEEDRAEQSRGVENVVTGALGNRLAEADAKKLHDVTEDVAKARGDYLTAAVAWDDPQGLAIRAPVRDAEAATRAVRGAVDLAKVAPFKELFRVRDITSTNEEVPGLGKTSVAMITREPSKGATPRAPRPAAAADAGAGAKPPRKEDFGLAWIVAGGVLSLATGDAPLATLGETAHPTRKLSDEPAVARPLSALGSDSSAVLVVQPLRFDPVRAHLPVAPVVIALGRKSTDATFQMDVANGLLRELARWQMGL